MKRLKSLLMIMMLTASVSTTAWAYGDANPLVSTNSGDYVSGQLVVSIENSNVIRATSIDEIEDLHISTMESDGFKVVDSLLDAVEGDQIRGFEVESDNIKDEVVKDMGFVYLVEYPGNFESPEQASQELEQKLKDQGYTVRYVEKNYTVQAYEEGEPVNVSEINENQRWHYEMIHAPQAWEITKGDRNVKVAIVDTGIDYTHKNLANLVDVSLGKSFVGGTAMDGHYHGTHVAGTVSSYGEVSGVTSNVTLIPVRVLDETGHGSTYGVQEGIVYAASIDADVINMSLGGGDYSKAMEDACNMATEEGTVVIAATGNENTTVGYPAGYDSVLSVGAVDSNKERAWFSNYGEKLDVMAPGVAIYSTVTGNGYKLLNGTSMATPHVAGIAALMKSVNKEITPQEIKEMIISTTQPAGDGYYYGSGIVDAYAAVLKAMGKEAPVVDSTPAEPTPEESAPAEEPVLDEAANL